MAIDFYRTLLRASASPQGIGDPTIQHFVEQTLAAWQGDPSRIADCLQRCLEAQAQIFANANQATLIECWLDDLSQIGMGQASPLI